MPTKFIYRFGNHKADGNGVMEDLLGGKGAGLAEMTRSGAPVPAGFTVTTDVCRYYLKTGSKAKDPVKMYPPTFLKQFDRAVEWLQQATGKRFGDPQNPLLVSVRSGAKFSMPGMMDTILNLGISVTAAEALAKRSGQPRFAWDAYRRFVQMFGATAMGIEKKAFEHVLAQAKAARGVSEDTDLDVDALKGIVADCKGIFREKTGREFPDDPKEQLAMARDAVFRSWMNPRAQSYRKLNKISEEIGTAVNVVEMVFGNMGWDSGTGVGFTRNPASGAKEF
ncbi:MAG: PEP/pyruvate-binding domain-containing protein, partial [Elusimicrobiota bacterium]